MDNNIIAAGDKTTVEAAKEILWLGGNAYDAAVAAEPVPLIKIDCNARISIFIDVHRLSCISNDFRRFSMISMNFHGLS